MANQSLPVDFIQPQSPGIQGLQGAADLLKGFATGVPVSNLSGATWPATVQMTATAPGGQQYVYQAPAGTPQAQMVYTHGQPQTQQMMYAPAPGQASVTLGADGQYYLTTAPAPYAMASPAPTGEHVLYATSAPAPMITYAPAPPDGISGFSPTVQFIWPQQLQQQGQAWIQQAQQLQHISQPVQQSHQPSQQQHEAAQQQQQHEAAQQQQQQHEAAQQQQQQETQQQQQQQVQQYHQQFLQHGEQQQVQQQIVYIQQPTPAITQAPTSV
jgi:hypothetical protein